MAARRVLIFGVTGQDGAYLSSRLLERGYEVHGASRDARASAPNLQHLDLAGRIELHSAKLTEAASVRALIESTRPHEVYNLAGQSSVGRSFVAPMETIEGIVASTVNILEAIRAVDPTIRFYNAGSSEVFGNTVGRAAETHPFMPRSPYGVAKAAAVWTVRNYREAYGLFACSGLLFNHESPLRPRQFVTQKVIKAAADIAAGVADQVRLGDLEVVRDWGWAPEYVEAMHLMLTRDAPADFVIASGRPTRLRDFVAGAFALAGLDWRRHVVLDPSYQRPLDISHSVGDPSKAQADLGWSAQLDLNDIVRRLSDAEAARRSDAQEPPSAAWVAAEVR